MKKVNKRHQKKWMERIAEQAGDRIKIYSSSDSFYTGDLINHEHFGKGRVESSFGNKIEVIFQDKMRILIHKLVF